VILPPVSSLLADFAVYPPHFLLPPGKCKAIL